MKTLTKIIDSSDSMDDDRNTEKSAISNHLANQSEEKTDTPLAYQFFCGIVFVISLTIPKTIYYEILTQLSAPEVNTGSMADIAFFVIDFLLVTTTISADMGINRELPELCPPGENCTDMLLERNVLRISLNADNEIFVKDKIIQIEELKPIVKAFLDNNGDSNCTYCDGLKLIDASVHPSKAVISLSNDPMTSYTMYVAVQDELSQAYYELREAYAIKILGKANDDLSKKDLNEVKKAYPFKLSEAESSRSY